MVERDELSEKEGVLLIQCERKERDVLIGCDRGGVRAPPGDKRIVVLSSRQAFLDKVVRRWSCCWTET